MTNGEALPGSSTPKRAWEPGMTRSHPSDFTEIPNWTWIIPFPQYIPILGVYIYIIQVNSVNSWLYIYIHNHTMNNPWNHHFFWLFYRLFYEKNPLWHRRKAHEPLVPRWWEGSPSPCRSGADPWWYLVKQCHKQSPQITIFPSGLFIIVLPTLFIYIHSYWFIQHIMIYYTVRIYDIIRM